MLCFLRFSCLVSIPHAWVCSLKADHWNINQSPNQQYDLGIVIIPKKNPQFDLNKLKQYCNKIAVMQEGPNWYWQDYPLEQQIWYYNTLQEMDFLFVHNEIDKKYKTKPIVVKGRYWRI